MTTAFLTTFLGLLAFVFGQFFLKLLVEPVHEFKRVIADIAHGLIEYADTYGNPGVPAVVRQQEAHDQLRKLSSRLIAQMYLLPCYDLTARVFRLPAKAAVDQATRYLIGLSNGVFASAPANVAMNNATMAQRIRDALGIYVPEQERLTLNDNR